MKRQTILPYLFETRDEAVLETLYELPYGLIQVREKDVFNYVALYKERLFVHLAEVLSTRFLQAIDSMAYVLTFTKEKGVPDEFLLLQALVSQLLHETNESWFSRLYSITTQDIAWLDKFFILIALKKKRREKVKIWLPLVLLNTKDRQKVIEIQPYQAIKKEAYLSHRFSHTQENDLVVDLLQAVKQYPLESRLSSLKQLFEEYQAFNTSFRKQAPSRPEFATFEYWERDLKEVLQLVNLDVPFFEESTPIEHVIDQMIPIHQLEELSKKRNEETLLFT